MITTCKTRREGSHCFDDTSVDSQNSMISLHSNTLDVFLDQRNPRAPYDVFKC